MPSNVINKDDWGGEAVFDLLLADIRSRRQEFEDQKFVSQDIIERFKEIGVYRALVPKRFGGDEKTPRQFLQMVEAIAAADGSAGWVASFGMNPTYLAALPEETITKLWMVTPDVVFAGGIFPPQPAERVEGGYKLNGRWQFGSGCMGATVLGVGIMPNDGSQLPRMAVLSPDQVTIEQTWNVVGLVGTGSHDLVVNDAVVAEENTFTRGGAPSLDDPIFRYPSLAFAAQVLSIVTLGLAREAIDEVLDMQAKGRKSVTGAPQIGDRPYVQMEIAKAEAKLQACRAFFYNATDEAWTSVNESGKPSDQQISMVRLAASHLTHECAEVVRMAYQVAGMTGAYNDHPLSRLMRDSMMCTQHAFMGAITFQNAGAMAFGNDPLPGYL
jgi:alkylation response protein AidB-like acyl-CoA dehydrogenase